MPPKGRKRSSNSSPGTASNPTPGTSNPTPEAYASTVDNEDSTEHKDEVSPSKKPKIHNSVV